MQKPLLPLPAFLFLFLVSGALLTACGGGSAASDPQTPPVSGGAALEAWIAQGSYKTWACETSRHPNRSPSPHGTNRICSNALTADAGPGEFPVGSAAVKELYAEDGGVNGYAVSRHTVAGTTGDTWYWYERTPGGVVADGMGGSGPAKNICVGCHQGAGSDAAHSGHDYVYTQVH